MKAVRSRRPNDEAALPAPPDGLRAPAGTPDLPGGGGPGGRGCSRPRWSSYNVENLFDTKDDPRTNDDDFTPGGRLQWTADCYATKLSHPAQAILERKMAARSVPDWPRWRTGPWWRTWPAPSPWMAGTRRPFRLPDERAAMALLVRRVERGGGETPRVDLDGDHTRDVLYARLGTGGRPGTRTSATGPAGGKVRR